MRYDTRPFPSGKNKDINQFTQDVQNPLQYSVEVVDFFKAKKEQDEFKNQ